jgi:hypothetical protein
MTAFIWNTGEPPNETLVEAENQDGEILRVMAWFGREGEFPHWRSEDGNTKYPCFYFKKWRPIAVKPLTKRTMTLEELQLKTLELIIKCEKHLERMPYEEGLSDDEFIDQVLNKFQEDIVCDMSVAQMARDQPKTQADNVDQHNAWVEELKADVEFEPLKEFLDRLKE